MTQKQSRPWNARRMIGDGRRSDFAFSGAAISSIRLGGCVKLYLDDDFATHIELWMPFTVEQYGQSHTYSPRETTALAPLLALIGQTIVNASVRDGFLTLEFDNKMTIQAPPDQSEHRWEAWQITDRHGFHVVCAIGGGLAVWMPDAETSRRGSKSNDPYRD